MKEKLYLENDKITGKNVFLFILIMVSMLAGFYLSGVLFLSLAHFVFYGVNDATVLRVEEFLLRLKAEPAYLWTAYETWFYSFFLSIKYGKAVLAGFLALLAPLLVVAATLFAYVKSPYSFKLWYRLKNHYARPEDVRQMGLAKGLWLVLGRFQNQLLKLSRPLSVFVWGGIGSGKTTGVAIPSILETDNACIAAVDSSGILAKYTSGHRAKLGPVFYFNWALQDVPEKGEYWPRWNPVSPQDLPAGKKEREAYVRLLAECLLPRDKDNYWEDLTRAALEGLLLFFISKIEKACANDYFLSCLLEKKRLVKDDRDLLRGYYAAMPEDIGAPAVSALINGEMDLDNYLPVGSWENIPDAWKGKELCLGMLADCLVQRYFIITGEGDKPAEDGWKIILGQFLKEASVFNYDPRAIQILQQLYYLTRNQRKIVFTMLMAPLTVFRKSNVRERTSLSDFSLRQLRGFKDGGEWKATTLYLIADAVKASKFMSRLMIDMLIGINAGNPSNRGPFPLALVLDDFEQLPKFSKLSEGLLQGAEVKMPLMMLTDGLQNIQRKYGADELEEIIANTSYKLMMAENHMRLSEHFNKLAVYGTKSVQIPAVDTGAFFQVKKGLADANYYCRIARDLKTKSKAVKIDREHYLLLAAGYYHLPVSVVSAYFIKDEEMKRRAAEECSYFLEQKFVSKRNMQDVEVPKITAVLSEAGVRVDQEEEIDVYLEDKYDEVVDSLDDEHSDIRTVWAEEISTRWQSNNGLGADTETHRAKNDDWWLSEDAFGTVPGDDGNPFEKPIK